MSWEKQETADGVGIGDGEGQRKVAGGLLASIKTVEGDNGPFRVYDFVQKDGETLPVFGSAAIDRYLNFPVNVGKFVKLVFERREKTGGGREVKIIDVIFWEEEKDGLTDDMKASPQLKEIRGKAAGAARDGALDREREALSTHDESDPRL